MVEVEFEYKDQYSRGQWNKQSCRCSSLEECKKFYGLGIDPNCEYRILSVKEI